MHYSILEKLIKDLEDEIEERKNMICDTGSKHEADLPSINYIIGKIDMAKNAIDMIREEMKKHYEDQDED